MSGIPIDELPEEYVQCREQIAILRKFEEQRKAEALEKSMQKSVRKHVGDNQSTREELSQIQMTLEKGRETSDG